MSTMLKRLITEQNTLWSRMQDIRTAAEAQGRDWTAEERANWDAAEADLDRVSGDIERLERQARLDRIDYDQVAVASGGEENATTANAAAASQAYEEAWAAYMRRGMARLSAAQQEIMARGYSEISNALGTSPDTAGGYLVPEGFRTKLTETLKAYGGLLAEVEVISTSSGQDLPWPTNDDTNNEGEIIGEDTQVGEQDVAFGGRKLKAHIFSSKLVKLPFTLLQDSAFNLDTWLPGKLGERIGRRAARAWTTGTGVDQPEGITVNATVGKQGTTGQTTSIIYTDLIDLEHSVDPAYRGRAKYAFHDLSLKVLRKLVDGQQRPLWVPVPAPGFPATINGWPYIVDNSLPVMAASAKSIVFGDLRAAYIVRQVLDVQTLRLTERYAEFLQVGFIGFARMDGAVQDPSAYRVYQNSAS